MNEIDPKYLLDIISKISLLSKKYIINYDGYEDFDYVSYIHEFLNSDIERLKKFPIQEVKTEIEKTIIFCFIKTKDDLLYDEMQENLFIDRNENDTIIRATQYELENYRDIDLKLFKNHLDSCFASLKTLDHKDSNSFLLSQIDIELYQALISNPDLIKTLNWRLFEKLIADILESFNYEVELMQGTKDNGIDVIAVKKVDVFGIHRYLIQAKRWNNKVGVEPVERLLFKQKDFNATKACLVTTSHFTKGAWLLAQNYKYSLELKDFERFQDWLKQAAIIKTKFNTLDIF